MNVKKNKLYLNIILFFAVLLILPLLTLILPKAEFSKNENRYLQELPVPTFETLKDKSFMTDAEKYFSDHFILRESWIKLKNQIELLTNKKEIKGVYLTKDRMIEHQKMADKTILQKNAKAIREFSQKQPIPTYLMVVPTAESIYSDQLPANAPFLDQKELIDEEIYNTVSNGSVCFDVFTPLFAARDQYIYYRTDHHWTSMGAYLGYLTSAKQMGFSPLELDRFTVEHASHSFQGTLYSKTLSDVYEPDMIDLYYPGISELPVEVTVRSGTKVKKSNSVFFRDYLKEGEKDQYCTYLGQNEPFVSVENHTVNNQKKLLIIKDSYAHSMVQFYMHHYSQIDLVDLRYMSSLDQYVNLDHYDQILFVYNFASMTEDSNIYRKLSLSAQK